MEKTAMKRLDTDATCRICLHGTQTVLEPIFGDVVVLGCTISQMLSAITRYNIHRHDFLPDHICKACLDAATQAYSFKLQAEKAYRSVLETEADAALFKVQMMQDYRTEIGTQTDEISFHLCELCDEKFIDGLQLRQHRILRHRQHGKQCKFCNERFNYLRQLQSHLALSHPSEGLSSATECLICKRRFSRRDHLRRHMRNVHDKRELEVIKPLEEPEIDIGHGGNCAIQGTGQEGETINAHSQGAKSKIDTRNYVASWLSGSEGIDETDVTDLSDADSDPCATNPIKFTDDDNSETEMPVEKEPIGNSVKIKLETNISIKVESDLEKGSQPDSLYFENSLKPKQQVVEEECNDSTTDAANANVKTFRKSSEQKRLKSKPIAETASSYEAEDKVSPSPATNECSQCKRIFSRHGHLLRHMRTHLGEKPHRCVQCTKTFARSDHLRMHELNVHSAKEFKCDQCDWAFVRSDALERHKDLRHGTGHSAHKIHPCEYCNKLFVSKTYLRKHTLMHTDRIFACKYCDATFRERKSFREHERTHREGKKYLCSVCGESFVRNDYLTVHMRRHNGEKPYKCKYCEKGFPRATDLNIHERYHTGIKPNLCTQCGKGFHRAYNLTIHMRTHSGERPFKCDQCPKRFTQSNDLKAHVRRHTGERYKCNDCDAAFLQLYGLRQHALAAHGVQIESITGRLQKFAPKSIQLAEPHLTQFEKISCTTLTKLP